MSFWKLNEGEFDKSGEFEVGSGDLSPIPAETSCLASIDEAKWAQDRENNVFISLRWTVLQPVEYKNRKIFQKLWVSDADPKAKDPGKKRDKALKMLAAIDTNAGGKLLAKADAPTDESLSSCLTNKPMIIKVMVWKIEDKESGETKSGNWIGAVSARSKTSAPPVQKKEVVEEDAPF